MLLLAITITIIVIIVIMYYEFFSKINSYFHNFFNFSPLPSQNPIMFLFQISQLAKDKQDFLMSLVMPSPNPAFISQSIDASYDISIFGIMSKATMISQVTKVFGQVLRTFFINISSLLNFILVILYYCIISFDSRDPQCSSYDLNMDSLPTYIMSNIFLKNLDTFIYICAYIHIYMHI